MRLSLHGRGHIEPFSIISLAGIRDFQMCRSGSTSACVPLTTKFGSVTVGDRAVLSGIVQIVTWVVRVFLHVLPLDILGLSFCAGVVWCGWVGGCGCVVWCGWCGVVWCGVVWSGRIHFHPKTISSTDTFIQKRFHPMTLSSKSVFIH